MNSVLESDRLIREETAVGARIRLGEYQVRGLW